MPSVTGSEEEHEASINKADRAQVIRAKQGDDNNVNGMEGKNSTPDNPLPLQSCNSDFLYHSQPDE